MKHSKQKSLSDDAVARNRGRYVGSLAPTLAMLGIFIFVLGIAPATGFVLAYLAACVLFGWFVHWLNQQAVKKQLMPYREELLNTLEQLEFNPNLERGTEE